MKKLLKTLFVMIIVGAVVAAVASYTSKKRLESKSDDEIREFLARKLEGKVGEEQLATIQEAVIGGIRGKSASGDAPDVDEVADASGDEPEEVEAAGDEAEADDADDDETAEKDSAE